MSSPTILEPTGTATDGTGQKWGGPNAKHAAQLLKGNHATEKIQVAAVADAVSLTGTQTISNKTVMSSTINASSNTLPDIVVNPEYRRVAGWIGGGVGNGFGFGNGLLNNLTGGTQGTPSIADGSSFMRWTTGAVSGDDSGQKLISGAAVLRGLDARFKCRFRLNTTSNVRCFIGLQNSSGAAGYLTGDDPLTSLHGVMICARSTDTNFQIVRNDAGGAGLAVFVDTGVAISPAAWHTIEIQGTDAGVSGLSANSFSWRVDGGSWTTYTTDIPASTTALYGTVQVETATTAAANMDVSWWIVEVSK